MITEQILNLIFSPILLLLNGIPSIDIAFPSVVFDPLVSVINTLGYIVPVRALAPILAISFAVNGAQTVWAIFLRIKSFIPTMGA